MNLRQAHFFFIAFVFIVLAAGCSSKPKLALETEKPLPEWYLNPPANTHELLTGIGAGKTLEDATDSALSNMVSRLGVSIESKFESITSTSQYSYSNKSVEYLKSEVSKIRVSNYELVFTEKIKYNEFVVMVQSHRAQFIKDLTQQVNDKLAAENQKINTARSDNALKRYHVAKNSADEVAKLESTIMVLSGMEPSFNNEYYQKKIQDHHTLSENARRNIVFVIKTDTKSLKASTPIKNALSQEGFKVHNSQPRDGVLFINLETHIQHNRSMGFQIAEMFMDLRTSDHQGKLIGSNSVTLTGHATRGFDMAEAAAIEQISEEIKKQGIAKLLGIEL